MAISREFKALLEETFAAAIGPVTIRAMFGGAGVFHDGVMFALVADDTLYLKLGPQTEARFEQAGLERFTYEAKGKRMVMSYARAPEAALEDPDILRVWAEEAIAVARSAASTKPFSKRRRRTATS